MEDKQQLPDTKTNQSMTAGRKRKLVLLFFGILILAVVAAIYSVTKPDNNVTTSSQTSTGLKTPAKITINATGYSPATITISKGGTVNWSNQDVAKRQVVISSYSGKENFSDFRTSDPIDVKGIYGITLYKVGTYSYHDQLDPNLKGKIQVK
jgi:plastocyanin